MKLNEQPWTPSSWRKYPIKQQAQYPDAMALEAVYEKCNDHDVIPLNLYHAF
jgi:3-deoxy-D-arabino-heptulosonate 7-phosphate (DAHP) synthase class II